MKKFSKNTGVLIIGGGLSGMHTAYELAKRCIDFRLVEAKNRLGGRILSKTPETLDHGIPRDAFDLGPSWFWPHQVRIQNLLDELGLTHAVFEQSETGTSLYEDQSGNIHQGVTGASMRGSFRINGGIQRIITELGKRLPSDSCLTQTPVKKINCLDKTLLTQVMTNNEIHDISSDFIILALPPRVGVESITFNPDFSSSRLVQLNSIATWMAGHAKVAVIYNKPFWHDQGFSGDVISQQGPLQEIHDASSPHGNVYGLIGFVGVAAQDRVDSHDELRTVIIEQLTRLFGEVAAAPIKIYIKDWARDPCTSTVADLQQMQFHPSCTLETVLEPGWDNRLIWSGTETARVNERNNGYMEGAIEASERTIRTLMNFKHDLKRTR